MDIVNEIFVLLSDKGRVKKILEQLSSDAYILFENFSDNNIVEFYKMINDEYKKKLLDNIKKEIADKI